MEVERLFGRPARRVLADCKRAMEANRKTSSDGSENASDKFEPEAKSREEEASQTSGIRAEGCADQRIGCGQGWGYIESDGESPRSFFQSTDAPARITDADSYQWSFHDDGVEGPASTDARRVIHVDFRSSGEPRPLVAGAGSRVVPFPAPAVRRMEW